MRIYVAGSTKGIPDVQAIMRIVRTAGHVITFDWTGDEGEIRPDWSEHQARAYALASTEREAVMAADALVLVPPPHGVPGLGCWQEVGMALARGIPVVLVGTPRESVFWYLPNVYRTDSSGRGLLRALEGAVLSCEQARESVLQEAERLVSGDRAASYGHPAEHSARVAGAWRSVFGWDVNAYRVNLAMAIFKVARAAVAPHRDSLVDVGGYARTAEAVLAREGAEGFQDISPPA